MGVIFLIIWLARLVGAHSTAVGWLIVACLAAALVILSIGVIRFWPWSRRLSTTNKLHRLATRNEATLRQDARRHLDHALRTLEAARRECAVGGSKDQAIPIDSLIRQIEVARDRVACDYSPSPANGRGQGRELDLDRLLASEVVEQRCRALARQLHDGLPVHPAQLSEVKQAVLGVDDRGLALS